MTLTEWPDVAAPASPVPAMTGVTVSLPPIEVLVRRWREIEPLLEKATRRTGCFEPIDLLMLTANGRAAMWVCMTGDRIDAACVAQVTQYPRRRVMEVMACGGSNMRAWLQMLVVEIDKAAVARGCSHVASPARPGWARAWGATPTGDVILVRDV